MRRFWTSGSTAGSWIADDERFAFLRQRSSWIIAPRGREDAWALVEQHGIAPDQTSFKTRREAAAALALLLA